MRPGAGELCPRHAVVVTDLQRRTLVALAEIGEKGRRIGADVVAEHFGTETPLGPIYG